MSTCSIQAPLDQDPPPRWSLGPWAHEPPRHVDFEEPILAHYIPRDSIQGRNDGKQTMQKAGSPKLLCIQN